MRSPPVMRTCCYTSFTYGYLSRARVLLQTLRLAQPDWTACAVIVDLPPPGATAEELLAGFDQVLTLDDLGIPRMRSWLFKHNIVEACTAVKGAALLRLLAEYDRVIYLDPDVAVFGPLDPALVTREVLLRLLAWLALPPGDRRTRPQLDVFRQRRWRLE